MNRDPLWKVVLNWGTVVTFLTLPLVLASIQIYINTHPGTWTWVDPDLTAEQRVARFQYLYDFMRNITILVFGLAGLRTWENVRNGKANNGNGTSTDKKESSSRSVQR